MSKKTCPNHNRFLATRILTTLFSTWLQRNAAGRYLDHLIVGLETGRCDLGDAQLFMVGLFGRHHRCVGHQREVDTRVRHQIRLQSAMIIKYIEYIKSRLKRLKRSGDVMPGTRWGRRWGRPRSAATPLWTTRSARSAGSDSCTSVVRWTSSSDRCPIQ